MAPRNVLRLCLVLGLLACCARPGAAQLRATMVVEGLNRPLGFVQHPSDPAVQVILEQGGRIRVIRNGQLQADDFLDLSGETAAGGERGLLGLAFARDFASSGRVFVSFTDRSGNSVVARFARAPNDPFRLDPGTRFDLVWPDGRPFLVQPFANHNGGNVAFGPDGYLYVGLGDGGSGNDPFNHAQHPRSLLGKMLRLDVSVPDTDPEGYDVPPDNPFAGRADVLSEIWAFGLRNPWRWSFDEVLRGGTGALVIGDVGQNAWEEIDYQPAGAGGLNYGWRNREGGHPHVGSPPPFSTPLTDPIWEYPRDVGRSVTGGFVYRGTALGPDYPGRYFFGDFATNRVFSLGLTIDPATGAAAVSDIREHTAELGAAAASPSSFGVDASGELYVVTYGGAVYRIDGPPGQQPADPPPPSADPPPGTQEPPFDAPGASDGRQRTGESLGKAQPRPR